MQKKPDEEILLFSRQAEALADDWIDAWNSHDLNRVLSHYTDDFEMTSPFISQFTGNPSGTLKGKKEVSKYWQLALEKIPDLHFKLVNVLVSPGSIVIYYHAVLGKMGAELLMLNSEGKIFKAIAHYESISFKNNKYIKC